MHNILSFLIVLGLLIFVHELGHFLLAKLFRIRVLTFSLGFGPRLAGFTAGGTDYVLSAFPLGGYVKMHGEDPGEELALSERAGAFSLCPVWQRFLVVAAGPLFNLLFAVVLFSGLYWHTGIPHPLDTTRIGSVDPKSPAAAVGIKPGDVIRSINGTSINGWQEVSREIRRGGGIPEAPDKLTITVDRAGKFITFAVTPEMREVKSIFGEVVEQRLMIGIGRADEVKYEDATIFSATNAGLAQTWNFTVLTVVGIGKIIQRVVPASDIGGPILIAQVAGQQLKTGWMNFVSFMALVSVNLAVLNLLPVPVLDGGHLFFYVLETIMRRPISIRTREMWQQVGIVLLGTLMVFVFYNDLVRLFSN